VPAFGDIERRGSGRVLWGACSVQGAPAGHRHIYDRSRDLAEAAQQISITVDVGRKIPSCDGLIGSVAKLRRSHGSAVREGSWPTPLR
jgi:hypothetical protein